MKNSTAFLGKNPFSSPYSCAASVLLCDSTSVGRPKLATTCAIVIVFPEPVTPRSVWYRSPRARPVMSSRMARGWSPAGANGDTSSKGMRGKLNRERRRLDRKSTRLNSSHLVISYAVFCLKKKKKKQNEPATEQ